MQLLLILPWGLYGCGLAKTQPAPIPASPPPPPLEYQTWVTESAILHQLKIPAHGNYQVKPVVHPQLVTLGTWLSQLPPLKTGERSVAALNAGFFDPANQRTTSYITVDQQVVADPTQNRNLMDNPQLQKYLPQILNRSEFRLYDCAGKSQYAIAKHSDPVPPQCQLQDALGAGPQLLPQNTAQAEAFIDVDASGTRIRDPIGIDRPNARSAIALTAQQDVIFLMAAQKPGQRGASGITLTELRDILKAQGAVSALNLDGGSSASFSYQGKTWYGKLDGSDQPIQRPIKSALVLYVRQVPLAASFP